MNAVDREGITPFMLAARAGSAAGVDALIAAHANLNATDHNGNTALMQAAAMASLATLERLLSAGANVAPRNVQDWSALDFAEVNHATRGDGAAAREGRDRPAPQRDCDGQRSDHGAARGA